MKKEKKIDLKEHIQTVIYRNAQLAPVIVDQYKTEFNARIVLVSGNGIKTNYLDISLEELEVIRKLLTKI